MKNDTHSARNAVKDSTADNKSNTTSKVKVTGLARIFGNNGLLNRSSNNSSNNALSAELQDSLLVSQYDVFDELAVGNSTDNSLNNSSGNSVSNYSNSSKGSQTSQQKARGNQSIIKKFISAPAYYWVIFSQFLVVSLHLPYMPIWIILFAGMSLFMQLPKIKSMVRKRAEQRLSIKRFKRTYFGIQITSFLLCVSLLWFNYRAFNVEIGIYFLLLCMFGKLWELYHRRDALVVLNLSLFVIASVFLLDKGLLTSVHAFVAILFVFMAFIALNDDEQIPVANKSSTAKAIKSIDGSGRLRSLVMLSVLSVPLLVILFLFFPRLPPLWTMQLSTGMAKTGVSDSMSPGDFAQLSKSSELAFRVEFEGDTPFFAQMYWRGLVFSDFDGKTWQQNTNYIDYWTSDKEAPQWLDKKFLSAITKSQENTQESNRYTVILEPTNNNWLYALDYPYKNMPKVALSSNYTYLQNTAVVDQTQYTTSYAPEAIIDFKLSEAQYIINTRLPATGNIKAQEFAQNLYKQSSSVEDYVAKITDWFKQEDFYYTLSPPKLDENRIDDFLFNTKKGFCEHYASSFVYLMRAADIPARVVVGYQGGKLGRDGTSWEVRQMDAHAWTEIWLRGKGWTRVDPTSFVAPERVEQGMAELTENSGASMFGDGFVGELSYQQFKMMQDLRRLSDQLGYYWQKNIVGYDRDNQSNKLFEWFNIKNMYQQVLIMIAIFSVAVSSILLVLWMRQRKKIHPVDKGLMTLSKKLGKADKRLLKHESEGWLAWLERINEEQTYHDYQTEIMLIKDSYRKLRYGSLSTDESINTSEYKEYLVRLNTSIKKLPNKIKTEQ